MADSQPSETQPLLLDAGSDHVDTTINQPPAGMGLASARQNNSSLEPPIAGDRVDDMYVSKPEGRAGDSLGFALVAIAAGYMIVSTWLAILLNDPMSLGLFAFHPPLQTLAIGLFAYAILTLQPTSQPRTKLAGLNRHQLIILGSAFPCIAVGTLMIIWNKNIHEKPHFVSWHGTFGIISMGWMAFQMFLGAGSVWYEGALFGGGMKAKSVWKYHRLSGYLLFPFFLTTVIIAGGWSHFTTNNLSTFNIILTYGICPLVILIGLLSRVRQSKMKFI